MQSINSTRVQLLQKHPTLDVFTFPPANSNQNAWRFETYSRLANASPWSKVYPQFLRFAYFFVFFLSVRYKVCTCLSPIREKSILLSKNEVLQHFFVHTDPKLVSQTLNRCIFFFLCFGYKKSIAARHKVVTRHFKDVTIQNSTRDECKNQIGWYDGDACFLDLRACHTYTGSRRDEIAFRTNYFLNFRAYVTFF